MQPPLSNLAYMHLCAYVEVFLWRHSVLRRSHMSYDQRSVPSIWQFTVLVAFVIVPFTPKQSSEAIKAIAMAA